MNKMSSDHFEKKDSSATAENESTDWPVFILSLEGDEKRRAPLIDALAKMGLAANVLIGVDGRNGLPQSEESRVDRDRPSRFLPQLTDGELACALSHVNAYQKILYDNLPGAIILEDDAKIETNLKLFMEKKGYTTGDMVLLGHGRCWTRWQCTRQIGGEIRLYRIVMMPRLAHAYSVSRKAAQALVSCATPVTEVADWPCDISKMNVLAADPQLAHQQYGKDEEHSHLQAARVRNKSNDRLSRPVNRHIRIFLKRLTPSWWKGFLAMKFGRKLS